MYLQKKMETGNFESTDNRNSINRHVVNVAISVTLSVTLGRSGLRELISEIIQFFFRWGALHLFYASELHDLNN